MAYVEYDGAHSITFGDGSLNGAGQFAGTNTWTDWHLIPSSRPVIPMPGFATKYVEIPGRDGSLDLSEFLVKRPVYGDRSGSIEFYVDHTQETSWIGLYRRIATFLHGRKIKMCLLDDPNYYYEGRFSLNEWASDPNWSRIVLNYQVGPYKFNIRRQGSEPMVWDTFNFDTDYDWYQAFHSFTLYGETRTWYMPGSAYPYTLEVTSSSGNLTYTFNGESVTPPAGTGMSFGHAVNDTNILTVSGSGTGTISFMEGSL